MKNIAEILVVDAICPSKSSNVVLVYKKDGSIRICIGFRKIYLHVVKDICMQLLELKTPSSTCRIKVCSLNLTLRLDTGK